MLPALTCVEFFHFCNTPILVRIPRHCRSLLQDTLQERQPPGYFGPCVVPSSWVKDGVSDLLLTEYSKSNSISLLRLLLLSWVPSLTLRGQLPRCELHDSEVWWQGTEVCSQQPVTACQVPGAEAWKQVPCWLGLMMTAVPTDTLPVERLQPQETTRV